ncbi:sialidase-4 [Corapipo altera]|uniref:sialidase-4 n=1 Tax=Corapipo altera TaxID=415028 RepID=UPI000FD6618D|nr:sialidase-4 [Corapipo altera]XP_027517670.1 sialidase-4 [Corapipo altera]XP_027517671.1 sialidase-4 [Corapipo altera]
MSSRHFPARTVLFERESNGVTYRVPALLYLPCVAKLLAFAEERLSADDAHANLLVLRRGTIYGSYVEWEDMRVLETATLQHHRSMNPCPLYDEFTGTLFLFFITVLGRTPEAYQIVTGQNVTRLCCVTSADQGLSWSTATDLTQQVIGAAIKDWATFALGPGHGIQLRSGRLLVPAYSYHIDCKECFGQLCKTTPHSFAFYSDDHGHGWRFGEFIPNLQTGECQLVSVDEEDGSNVLYCNARSPLGFRVQALSTDDGAVFHRGQLVQRLVEPPHGCHGSVIGFPAPFVYVPTISQDSVLPLRDSARRLPPGMFQGFRYLPTRKAAGELPTVATGSHHEPDEPDEDCPTPGHHQQAHSVTSAQGDPVATRSPTPFFQAPTWILYSHPTSSMSRVNMGVHLSTFPRDAESWTEPWVIYEGPSAYSDLAYMELPYTEAPVAGGTAIAFACLYENGTRSPYEQISFSMFTLRDVLQNIPVTATAPLQGRSPRRHGKRGRRSCPVS